MSRQGQTYRQIFPLSALAQNGREPKWVRFLLCNNGNILSVWQGEVKRTKSKGQRRAAFRLLDFKEPTRVLQMRVKRNKNVSPKEGWGQASAPAAAICLSWERSSRVGATEAGMTSSALRDS